jgi:DNA-directed RNA polymerase subunit RPC12/RpoP
MSEVDYKCIGCGEYKQDWWIEIGLIKDKSKAWCDDCKRKATEALISSDEWQHIFKGPDNNET